jgi:hypothetical protein
MVASKVSSHEREVIVGAFAVAATALTWKLTAPAFSRDAVDAAVACLKDKVPWTCASPGLGGSDTLVIVQVDADRALGMPMTVVTAHVLSTGTQSESTASRYCEMCTDDALKRAAEELSKQLLQEAAERCGRTKLAIRSRPDKAWLVLDGNVVGSTDATRATYPGRHSIALRHVGYKTAVKDVVAVDGKTLDVSIDLEPDPTSIKALDDHDTSGSDHPTLLPRLATGIGGAAVLAGVILIAVDGSADPHGRQQRYYYDTAAVGVGTLAVGAVVGSAGLYFLLRSDAMSAPTVAPLPGGGAAIGWVGRF